MSENNINELEQLIQNLENQSFLSNEQILEDLINLVNRTLKASKCCENLIHEKETEIK
ncbi:19946_t:CDS:1, partial [Dentiscutata erythropus]